MSCSRNMQEAGLLCALYMLDNLLANPYWQAGSECRNRPSEQPIMAGLFCKPDQGFYSICAAVAIG